MFVRDPRPIGEKVRLFRSRFSGLGHAHGTYDPVSGRAWLVRRSVDDMVVLDHLMGRKPLGIYLLTGTRTRALAVDFDSEDARPPVAFVNRAAHYGISCLIERSKMKGYHVWVFFGDGGVSSAKARAVARLVLDDAGHDAEIFPKQAVIDPDKGQWGNFVNLPFFLPRVLEGRTVFVDPGNGLAPYPDQWHVLEGVPPVPELLLDEVMELNGLRLDDPAMPCESRTSILSLGSFEASPALPPCIRRMLAEGVSEYQRVACFRIAVSLRRAGLPFGPAVAALMEWRDRNRPVPGKTLLTDEEVRSQASGAFLKEYRGFGCEEPAVAAFCDPVCSIARAVSKP